jgi:uncharacterized membrane protein YebE (DUF533 family)
MVNTDALKIGVLVILGLLGLVLLGRVIQIVSWLLSYAVVALLAVGGGYVAYELYSGWSSAKDENSGPWSSSADESADLGSRTPSNDRSVDDVQQEYTAGKLSDAEFERELERVMDDDGGVSDSREIERELERES